MRALVGCLLVLTTGLAQTTQAGDRRLAPNPPTAHATSSAPCEVVHVCILSDRIEETVAVVTSAQASAALATCLEWHVVTPEPGHLERLLSASGTFEGAGSRHALHATSLMQAEAALEEHGITPVWRRPGFDEGVTGKARRTLWSLRERAQDADPKHAHPLNLLRFYLPYLPTTEGVEKVLLLDDDVCVRHDLGALYSPPPDLVGGATHTPALVASCQMQHWAGHHFEISHATHTYADTPFLGTIGTPGGYTVCPPSDELEEEEAEAAEVEAMEAEADALDCDPAESFNGGVPPRPARRSCAPAALEPKLLQLHHEISGQHTYRNATAWNFGVTLIDLKRWQQLQLSLRLDQWFVANEHFSFFAPTSVSFGLGIPYLALSGHVSCWPEETVVDGLGFLTWADLQANGIGSDRIEVRASAQPP